MAYNQFTINQISKQFGIPVQEEAGLFPAITPVSPGDPLRILLKRYIPLAEAIGTEKAKSEFIVAPLLAEVRDPSFSRGDVGLIAGTWDVTGLIMAFDNFVVQEP